MFNRFLAQLDGLWHDLSHFPWRTTALTLRERFREDRLGLTASSLTFTTILALVPFFTVALAVSRGGALGGVMPGLPRGWLPGPLRVRRANAGAHAGCRP